MARRFRCLHVLLVSVIGSAILTAVIFCVSGDCKLPTKQERTPELPTKQEPAPDAIARNATDILIFINSISLLPNGSLQTNTGDDAITPEERAVTWLMFHDSLPLQEENIQLTFRQRYALASLWFQADEPWGDADGWMSVLPECSWEGVECNDSTNPLVITKLSLCCINLNGNLPVDLALLTSLTSFDVGRNSLSGTIPTEYTVAWSGLKEFFVGDNDLTGMVPVTSEWKQLEIFDIHANQFTSGLAGAWPTTLKTVYLYNNSLAEDLNSLCDNEDEMGLARVVADCDKVGCDCCTDCCPNATSHSC